MKQRTRGALLGRKSEPAPQPGLPPAALALLHALPLEWIVVGAGFALEAASERAAQFGVSDERRLNDRVLRGEVTSAVRSGSIRELEMDFGGASHGAPPSHVRIRIAPLGAERAALLFEDVSHPLRVDAMRRDFIVNVSHELKTPVGALLLLAEAVKSSADDPESLQRFTERIQLEAERLGRLINDLTDLSRLQAAEPSSTMHRIPVARLFAESVDSVRLLAENRAIEIVVGDVNGLTVVGDEDQLVTALRNLLLNAIAYSPDRTRVRLSARVDAERIDLMVSDQGIGISSEEQERIFERFYRVDPARSRLTGGTGLGLAIVKHIASVHGGECIVWSQPGEGSTFTLRLRHGHFDGAASDSGPTAAGSTRVTHLDR